MYQLPHKFPNDLNIKILGNKKISRKSLKCLELLVSNLPANQKENFDN